MSENLPGFRTTDEMRRAAVGLVLSEHMHNQASAEAAETIDHLYEVVGADNLSAFYGLNAQTPEGQAMLENIYDGDKMVALFEKTDMMRTALLEATFDANPDYLGVKVGEPTASGHRRRTILENKSEIEQIVNEELTLLIDGIRSDIHNASSTLQVEKEPTHYDRMIAGIAQAADGPIAYTHPEHGYYDTERAMDRAERNTLRNSIEEPKRTSPAEGQLWTEFLEARFLETKESAQRDNTPPPPPVG